MENWLVTAVAAATTALGAFVTSLGGAPAPEAAAQVTDPAHHAVAPARPGPAQSRSVAPAQPALDERPSRDAARPARHRTRHRSTHHRHHHAAQHRSRDGHRAGHRAHRRAGHHARHHAKHHAKHHARRQHARHKPHHHKAHHSAHQRRHGRNPTHTRAVRRAPSLTDTVLLHGVPARQVIGIRRALGMRPAMGDLGTDISWPQCPGGLPMPLAAARFVVVGLTNGPAFTPNHCLGRQAAWVRHNGRHVATYAVVSYPNRHELARFGGRGPFPRHRLVGRLRNVGYQQALTNLRRMHDAGLHSPLLWIDLEQSSSHPWRGRTGLNAAVVRGLVQGYRSHGQRIGFYSTASIWREIVGGLRFGAPEWRTAGPDRPGAALGRCHERDASIQGGPAVLAQWWNNRRDHDLICPGYRGAATMQRYFERP